MVCNEQDAPEKQDAAAPVPTLTASNSCGLLARRASSSAFIRAMFLISSGVAEASFA
jgi:hypothetical protein